MRHPLPRADVTPGSGNDPNGVAKRHFHADNDFECEWKVAGKRNPFKEKPQQKSQDER